MGVQSNALIWARLAQRLEKDSIVPMATNRTLAELRDTLESFADVHERWYGLMEKAIDLKDVPALRELFDSAPGVVTNHRKYMDLWRVLAQAEHEHDTTAILPPIAEEVLPPARPPSFPAAED